MRGVYLKKYFQYVPLYSSNNETAPSKEKKSRRLVVICFWVISFFMGLALYLSDMFEIKSYALMTHNRLFGDFSEPTILNDVLNGYLINTPGCRIPEMDPFDASVKKFIKKPDPLICNKRIPPLFESNLTSIYLNDRVFTSYNITDIANLSCSYQTFWRKEPSGGDKDRQIVYSENITAISDNITFIENEEFIKVYCENNGQKIYEDYFAFFPLKNEVEREFEEKLKPNILIMGLDAVSRVNFHRQLPLTYKYLSEQLGAFELLGYNKVADNTFVNLMPVLTGSYEAELMKTCWPNSSFRFDNCTFLWNEFSDNGYVTAFGEDCAWMGIFNYEKKGFLKQYTDYYYSSFNWESETHIGNNEDFNCKVCIGGRETYTVTLDYIRKFTQKMHLESLPHFGFFWSVSLSHDYLNYPSLGDQRHFEFLSDLKTNGQLDNTVLILMSDHGIRWGDIRQTYQGQLEERLPFVFIVLPESIRRNYPEAVTNLRRNTKRLTTPFDLHETIRSFLDVDSLKSVKKIDSKDFARGYSLFNEVPTYRTCEDATITSHWCTCQRSVNASVTDEEVVAAAKFAVNYMNQQLQGYAQCATLVLDAVLNARLLYHEDEEIKNGNQLRDYTITLTTKPGGGVFETTVRLKNNTGKSDHHNSSLSVTGTISRLNLYGKQSYCITDFHLKLYCYCKNLLNI